MEKIEVIISNYTGSGKVKAELYLGSGVIKYTEEIPVRFSTLQEIGRAGFTVTEFIPEPDPVIEVKKEVIATSRSVKPKKKK